MLSFDHGVFYCKGVPRGPGMVPEGMGKGRFVCCIIWGLLFTVQMDGDGCCASCACCMLLHYQTVFIFLRNTYICTRISPPPLPPPCLTNAQDHDQFLVAGNYDRT